MWIDSHCHLDAPEFAADRDAVRQQARAAGVAMCVLPAVQRRDWAGVQDLAPTLIGRGRDMADLGPLTDLRQAVALAFTSTDLIGPDLRVVARVAGRDRF